MGNEQVPVYDVWPCNRFGQRYSDNRVFGYENFPDFGLTIPGISKISTPRANQDSHFPEMNRHFPSHKHDRWSFMSSLTVMPRDVYGNIHSPQWTVHRTRRERRNCVINIGLLTEDVTDSELDWDEDEGGVPEVVRDMVADGDIPIPDNCSHYAYKVGSLDLLRSTTLPNHGEAENDKEKLTDQSQYDKEYGNHSFHDVNRWMQKQASTPQMREIISINSIFMHYFNPVIKQIYYGSRYQRNLIDVHYYHNRYDWSETLDGRIESCAKKIQDVVRMNNLKQLLAKEHMPTNQDVERFRPLYTFLPSFVEGLFQEINKMMDSYHASATTMPNHPSAQVITDEMKKTEQTIIWFAKIKDILDFSINDYNTFGCTIETFDRLFRCKITQEVKEKYFKNKV